MKETEFYRQAKAKIVYDLLAVFMRNIKETSLGRKERIMIRNMKIMKRKLSLVKVIYLFYNLQNYSKDRR